MNKHFDLVDYRERLGANEELMLLVVNEFRREIQDFMEQLEQAVRSGDLPKVAALSHRIKGASSEVSAMNIPTICKSLELAAKAEETDRVAILHQDLVMAIEAYRQELDQVLPNN